MKVRWLAGAACVVVALGCGGWGTAEDLYAVREIDGSGLPYESALPSGATVKLTVHGPPEHWFGVPLFMSAPDSVVVGVHRVEVLKGISLVSEPTVDLGIYTSFDTLAPGDVTLVMHTDRGRHTETLVIR